MVKGLAFVRHIIRERMQYDGDGKFFMNPTPTHGTLMDNESKSFEKKLLLN